VHNDSAFQGHGGKRCWDFEGEASLTIWVLTGQASIDRFESTWFVSFVDRKSRNSTVDDRLSEIVRCVHLHRMRKHEWARSVATDRDARRQLRERAKPGVHTLRWSSSDGSST
jgi:hypothetical protein